MPCTIKPTAFHIKLIAQFFVLLALAVTGSAHAGDEILRLTKISSNVYALEGPTGNRTPENLGNNATFGFVVTDEGVVLIDSGGSYKGAAMLHRAIRQVTDKPVTHVINSGGQDHRWMGNGYFREQGAAIIASARAVADQQNREQDQFIRLGSLIGDEGLEGTDAVFAETTFSGDTVLETGGIQLVLKDVGPAHTPGDTLIWFPDQGILFGGDVIFIQRMLGIWPFSSSSGWLKAFDAVESFNPEKIVPGHGPVADLDDARRDTRDYIRFLRDSVAAFMDEGHDIADIAQIDQSRFQYLDSYQGLKGVNVQQVFQEMEWE